MSRGVESGFLDVPVSEISPITIVRAASRHFCGFPPDAFDVLDSIREEPHIHRYQAEKERIMHSLKAPFMAYRDDLVMGYVLPNRLNLETERNIFSRLLKNDFGRGGCHHHFWMSFYRPGWTRLRDLQLIHSLYPDAFLIGVSASRVSRPVLAQLRQVVEQRPDDLAAVAEPLIDAGWELAVDGRVLESEHLLGSRTFPPNPSRVSSMRLLRRLPRKEVLDLGHRLVDEALISVRDVWPFYQLLLPD